MTRALYFILEYRTTISSPLYPIYVKRRSFLENIVGADEKGGLGCSVKTPLFKRGACRGEFARLTLTQREAGAISPRGERIAIMHRSNSLRIYSTANELYTYV